MKAAVYSKYGPPEVISIKDVPIPTPGDTDVLIKVHATTVSTGDWRARSLEMPAGMGLIGRLVFGITGPRNPILGTELSGVIEAVGKHVTKFAPGDEVIAYAGGKMRAHAEFIAMPQDAAIAPKPTNLSFEAAAAVAFGGDTALDFLRDKGNIQPGETVLVVGASGCTGSAVVQLAKHFGAHVTGVSSAANLDLVASLGADQVIDYTREDFATNGQHYDIIVDTTATAPWSRVRNSLTPTGRLLMISGSLGDMLRAVFVSRKNGRKLVPGVAMGSAENLRFLVQLVEAGHFKPLIDRSYPLDQIVAAHAHVDTGRKKGSVVISIVAEFAKKRSAV